MRLREVIAVLSIGLCLGACAGCGDGSPKVSSATTTTGAAASSGPGVGDPTSAVSAGSADGVPETVRLRARPESRAVQQWAAAYAEIVNAGDGTQAAAKKLMTRDGLDRMKFYTQQDWGRYLPGPLPITVTNIGKPTADGVTWVQACAQMRGWSQVSKTNPQTDERQIRSVRIGLKKEHGAWLVDGMSNGKDAACAGVPVEGLPEGAAG